MALAPYISFDDPRKYPPLLRLSDGVKRPDVRRVMGRAIAGVLRRHFTKLDEERPNALGGKRTHFYGQVRRSVQQPELLGGDGVKVAINHVGIAQRRQAARELLQGTVDRRGRLAQGLVSQRQHRPQTADRLAHAMHAIVQALLARQALTRQPTQRGHQMRQRLTGGSRRSTRAGFGRGHSGLHRASLGIATDAAR